MKKSVKNTFLLATILVLTLIALKPLAAQMTVRGFSMGGAYTALARGVHAPAWNPANLGLPDNPKFSMTFVAVSAGADNNSFDRGDVYDYEGRFWTKIDKDNILSLIPDRGLKVNMGASARFLSMSIGRFALTIQGEADVWTQVDKTVFDLLLKGNVLNRDYNFDDVDGRGTGVASVGFSWGQPIKVNFADHFAVGASFNLQHGLAHANVESMSGLLRFETGKGMVLDGNYESKMALGSLGWGFDLGAVAQFEEEWTAGISFMNLFGSLPWENDGNRVWGNFTGDSLFIGMLGDDDDGLEETSEREEGLRFNQRPPTVMRIGGAYTQHKTTLTADYVQGFREGLLSSTTPQLSVGTEWRGLSWLPLRAGVVFGGRLGFGTSLGLGIRPPGFYLDIGLMSRSFMWLNTVKGVIFGFDMGLHFNR